MTAGLEDRRADARGRVMIVTAALLWSSSGLFAKAPWFADWPLETRGLGLAFWRAAFAAVLMLPLVRRPQLSWTLLPMGTAFAVMTSTFLTSMVLGSEANAIWLQYLAPAWVVLAARWGLGDRPQSRDWVLIAAACGGVAFILAFELAGARPLASGLAILSGLAFAVVLVCLRRLSEGDGAWLGLVNHGFTAVLLATVALTAVPWPTLPQFAALLLFAALQLALPYLLFARALRRIPSYEGALLGLLEPVTVPMWTFVVWRHHPAYRPPDWWTLVGGGLILLGFVYRYWPRRPTARAA